MLKDLNKVNGRAMQLATHLFALRTCVEELHDFPLVFCSNALKLATNRHRLETQLLLSQACLVSFHLSGMRRV